MPRSRGGEIDAVIAGIVATVSVVSPAASISRCAKPTARQQKGHTGTIKTTSTSSARSRATICGTVLSSNGSTRSR